MILSTQTGIAVKAWVAYFLPVYRPVCAVLKIAFAPLVVFDRVSSILIGYLTITLVLSAYLVRNSHFE